jgi:hypothetical protein
MGERFLRGTGGTPKAAIGWTHVAQLNLQRSHCMPGRACIIMAAKGSEFVVHVLRPRSRTQKRAGRQHSADSTGELSERTFNSCRTRRYTLAYIRRRIHVRRVKTTPCRAADIIGATCCAHSAPPPRAPPASRRPPSRGAGQRWWLLQTAWRHPAPAAARPPVRPAAAVVRRLVAAE